MKKLIYIIFVFFLTGYILVGCDVTENDIDSGWDINKSDSSNVRVDTLDGTDVSMYEKARIFPGLVDTAKEVNVKDTMIALDLSKKYASMLELGLKNKASTLLADMPQPIYSTGLYAGAGEAVTITVPENVWGLTAQIGVQTEDLTKNNAGLRESIVYVQKTLYPGKNIIRSSLGGYLWIIRADQKIGDPITNLKIENVYSAADFILGQTNPDEWAKKVRTTTVPWMDLRGEHFTFSVDRQRMLQYLDADPRFAVKLEKSLTVWNQFLKTFYASYGLREGEVGNLPEIPLFPERFVFDVQLSNNSVIKYDNKQALMMVNTNRLYENLVDLDSLAAMNVLGVYRQFYAKYKQSYGLEDWWRYDMVPLFRQSQANVRSGLASSISDLGINFNENVPSMISYAAADSAKSVYREIKSSQAPGLLAMIQLAEYGTHYQHDQEWNVFTQLWNESRKRKRYYKESGLFQYICNYFRCNLAPFFEHWGLDVSDEALVTAYQYPLLDKEIWKIDPLSPNPYAEVGNYDKSKYRFRVDRSGWQILATDASGNDNEDNQSSKSSEQHLASGMIDGDKGTYWRNYLESPKNNMQDSPYEQPYYVVIDLGKDVPIDGFYFANGNIGYNWQVNGFRVQTTNARDFELQDHLQQTWSDLGEVGTEKTSQRGFYNEQFYKFYNGSHTVRYLRLVFDKPNRATYETAKITEGQFKDNHMDRRQQIAEFGVYYYQN